MRYARPFNVLSEKEKANEAVVSTDLDTSEDDFYVDDDEMMNTLLTPQHGQTLGKWHTNDE